MAQSIFSLSQARDIAQRKMPKLVFDFLDGATGDELANANNQRRFSEIKLKSKVLINVEEIELATRFMGKDYALPIGIAPMGMCNLLWPRADQALSRLARDNAIPHCVSTAASSTIEEMFDIGGTNAWFQLYAGANRDMSAELVERAETCGYETLVFTVDTPRVSRRIRDEKNGLKMPFKMGFKQFFDFVFHPQWALRTAYHGAPKVMNFETSKLAKSFDRGESRGGSDWQYLKALRKRWKGKLILKGVMDPADAIKAKQYGVDAVYVSNHGGRQLDSAPAAIDSLPLIRKALGDHFPILFDSGVRSAEDMIKALGLGANFVLMGRGFGYALGAKGEAGPEELLKLIQVDLMNVMAQIGITKISDIDHDIIFTQEKR